MCENSEVAGVLRRVRVSVYVWRPDDETIRLLCMTGIDELQICSGSIRMVELLFLWARENTLAGRLRRLILYINSRYGRATEVLSEVSFLKLERVELYVFGEAPVDELDALLGSSMKAKVNVLFVGRRGCAREEDGLIRGGA